MILANKKGTERFKNLWKESLKTPNGPIMERNIYLQYIVTENYIWELYILLPRFLGWHIFHMAQPSNKLTMKNPRIFGESKTFWTPPKELRKQKQVLSFKASTATSRSLDLWLVRCLGSNVLFLKLNMKCFLDTLQPQVIPDTGLTSPYVPDRRWVLMYITDADVPHAQGVVSHSPVVSLRLATDGFLELWYLDIIAVDVRKMM